jgi:hypothetical protein
MTINIDDRERHRRTEAAWSHRPGATADEIAALVDAELEAEAAARAESDAKVNALVDSFVAMTFTCASCGNNQRSSAHDALCDKCRSVNRILEAESAALDDIGGTSRRQLVEAYRQRKEANS